MVLQPWINHESTSHNLLLANYEPHRTAPAYWSDPPRWDVLRLHWMESWRRPPEADETRRTAALHSCRGRVPRPAAEWPWPAAQPWRHGRNATDQDRIQNGLALGTKITLAPLWHVIFILKFYGLIDIVNRWHIFYTDSYSTLLFQVRLASATAPFLLLKCQVRAPRPTFGVKTAAACGSARTLKARVRALHQGWTMSQYEPWWAHMEVS